MAPNKPPGKPGHHVAPNKPPGKPGHHVAPNKPPSEPVNHVSSNKPPGKPGHHVATNKPPGKPGHHVATNITIPFLTCTFPTIPYYCIRVSPQNLKIHFFKTIVFQDSLQPQSMYPKYPNTTESSTNTVKLSNS